MYFAIDPYTSHVLASELVETVRIQPDHHNEADAVCWLALFDSAFDHDRSLLKWPYESLCIYENHERVAGLSKVAPKLLVLSDPHTPEFKSQINRLLLHCNGRPMVRFFAKHG